MVLGTRPTLANPSGIVCILMFPMYFSPKWNYWKVMGPLRDGSSGKCSGHWGCGLEGDSETHEPFSSYITFLLSGHEVSGFAPLGVPCHDVFPHHRPKSNEANQPWTETSKIIRQCKFFLFID
jgi:hypothetical protein